MSHIKFKAIVKTSVSLKSIYECRKEKTYVSILFFLLINVGFVFPFIFGILTLEQVTIGTFLDPSQLEAVNESKSLDFLKTMSLVDGYLEMDDNYDLANVPVGNYTLSIDLKDTYTRDKDLAPTTIRLSKAYMEMNLGVTLFADYQHFEDINFTDMSNEDILDYFIMNGLRSSVAQWVYPVALFFYLAFVAINLIFVLGMSFLAMIFRVRDHVKLSYKETLNIVIYASVMPIIISVVVTMIFNALGLNLIIYNFGTIIVYMLVRKKYLKHVPVEEIV